MAFESLKPLSNFKHYEKYADFVKLAEADTQLTFLPNNIQGLYVENGENTYQGPWGVDVDIAYGAHYFEYLDKITHLIELEDLKLIGLYVSGLPQSFPNLKKLHTLELCFAKKTNVDEVIRILEKMPSLKRLDINHSRLSTKQRIQINKALSKKGVFVNDYIYLSN
ncbi:hypothetical protein [Mucilaginibacter defluvii]|uniref:Leucine rich repeat (LRR) protein n=1 Tax=Mucilaginibacter defluvii TaxID=1196019 RepID=A0ABP9G5T9_9SPHI